MYEFKVQGMTCPSCAKSMRMALHSIDAEADVEVNLPSQTVKVKSSKSQKEVAAIIEEAGYPVLEARQIT